MPSGPTVSYWSNGQTFALQANIGVRFPGTAPGAASSMVERQALNLCLGQGSSPWRRTMRE